jgi:hypothetical protein
MRSFLEEAQPENVAMGSNLLPMTLSELCMHALRLEQGLGLRYGEYAKLTRAMGAHEVSDAFAEMERLEEQEARALSAGVDGAKRPERSAWQSLWQLTYAPVGMESHKRVRPQDAREALQLALAAERRAESFYSDTATNARDAMVRSCAAELAEIKGLRLRQLEHLLARQARTSWFGLRLRAHLRTRARGA